ncbi:hypothetical protein H5410_050861, partial [Solanum commersonii]
CLKMCCEGPFGEVSRDRRYIRRFAIWSISSPSCCSLSPLCVLSRWEIWYCFAELFGYRPTTPFHRQLDLFLQGSVHWNKSHLVPSCQIVSMLCLKSKYLKLKDFHQILRQNMHLRTLILSKYSPK